MPDRAGPLDEELGPVMAREVEYVWRTGRSVGRTIYMQLGGEPSDDDVLIGVMDSPEIAAEVVVAHNERLVRRGR